MKLFTYFTKNKAAYICPCCGKVYEQVPLCFGSDYPIHYFAIPPTERALRIELKESLCVVDGQHFYHRGRLTIPINDHDENLVFNVWSSISEDNFKKRMDLWENPDRIKASPYFGWLNSQIPTYGEKLNLKIIATEQMVGHIPEIKSIEEGHRLTTDQENGVTYKQAIEIVDEIIREQHRADK